MIFKRIYKKCIQFKQKRIRSKNRSLKRYSSQTAIERIISYVIKNIYLKLALYPSVNIQKDCNSIIFTQLSAEHIKFCILLHSKYKSIASYPTKPSIELMFFTDDISECSTLIRESLLKYLDRKQISLSENSYVFDDNELDMASDCIFTIFDYLNMSWKDRLDKLEIDTREIDADPVKFAYKVGKLPMYELLAKYYAISLL